MGASEHFVSLYVHLSPLECNFFVTIDALLTLSFVVDDRPAVECKRAGSLLKGAAARADGIGRLHEVSCSGQR